jgi:hypothetical protein
MSEMKQLHFEDQQSRSHSMWEMDHSQNPNTAKKKAFASANLV